MGRLGRRSLGVVSAGVLSVMIALGCGPGGGGSASTGGSTSGAGGSPGGGAGGLPEGDCGPNATDATVYQVADPNAPGAIGQNIQVRLAGVIAISDQFLVSHSKATGTCLWGLVVSAPSTSDGSGPLLEAAAHSGVLVLSYGPDAQNGAPCPKDGSAIPTDVKPGDALDVIGTTSRFLPPACGALPTGTDIGQAQISPACKVEKTGVTLPVPTPHLLTAEELALLNMQHLADPGAEAFHDAWGSVRVRTPMVTAKLQTGTTCGPTMALPCCGAGDPCIVDPWGSLVLDGSGAVVSDRLYAKSGPPVCSVHPDFTADPPPHLTFVEGVMHLDFCTWSLEPIDKCADYDPAPDDCVAAGVVSCL